MKYNVYVIDSPISINRRDASAVPVMIDSKCTACVLINLSLKRNLTELDVNEKLKQLRIYFHFTSVQLQINQIVLKQVMRYLMSQLNDLQSISM